MSDRTPLVLVPGLLCDAELWRPQAEGLVDLIDPIVADVAQDDHLGGMAERILATGPPRFALAGLSMGGYVAQEVMRRAADRVLRLALLDTSARPDSDEQRARRRGLIALARRGQFKGVTPRLLPLLVHQSRLGEGALTQTIMAMAERVGRDAFLRQQTAILGRPDGRPGLPRITCPTLVLCGDADALTPPEHSREMAAAIPGAALEIVPVCGHLSTLERPQAVNAALRRWLES